MTGVKLGRGAWEQLVVGDSSGKLGRLWGLKIGRDASARSLEFGWKPWSAEIDWDS